MLDEVQGSKWVGSCAVARAAASLKFIAGPRWKVAPRLLFESCARRRDAKEEHRFSGALVTFRFLLVSGRIEAPTAQRLSYSPTAHPVHTLQIVRTA
jgi:hypothetical protein